MEEVLRASRLPNKLVGSLSTRFRVIWEDGGALYLELCAKQRFRAFLRHVNYRVDLVPGMEFPALMGAGRGGTVHLLKSLLSNLVVLYSTDRQLLTFSGEIPSEGLLLVADIPE